MELFIDVIIKIYYYFFCPKSNHSKHYAFKFSNMLDYIYKNTISHIDYYIISATTKVLPPI